MFDLFNYKEEVEYDYPVVKILGKYRVPKNNKYNPHKKTTEEYAIKLFNVNKDIIPIEPYKGRSVKSLHKCLICSYEWLVAPGSLLRGIKCPRCQELLGKYHKKKTHEEYVKELKELNPNIRPIEEYNGCEIYINHECLLCGNVWSMKPSNALHGCGCPKCKNKQAGLRRRKDNETYIKQLRQLNPFIQSLEEYISDRTKIKHRCLICGEEFYLDPNHALQGVGCSKCNNAKRIKNRTKTTQQFINELKQINPLIKVIGEYINAKTKIEYECLICSYHWKSYSSNVLKGHGCPNCAAKANGERFKKTNDEYIQQLQELYPHITALEEYKNSAVSIKHHCSLCNNDFYNRPANVLTYGCPRCKKLPKGEQSIIDFLDKYNINYIYQKNFKGLIGRKRKLWYDFYLPDYNLLIEFNGQQHEKPIEYFGGEEKFKEQQEYDKKKKEFASNHNIKLLTIWYYDYAKIEEILSKELNLKSVETVEVA